MSDYDHNSAIDRTYEVRALESATFRMADMIGKAEEKIAAAGRIPEVIGVREAAGMTDLLAQMRAVGNELDRLRADESAPYSLAVAAVRRVPAAILERLSETIDAVALRLVQHQEEEDRKVTQARQEREAAAEAAGDPMPGARSGPDPTSPTSASGRAPAPPPKRRMTTTGIQGAKATLSYKNVIEIVNVRALPDRYLNRPRVVEALIKELQRDVDQGDKIDGITVSKQGKTTVRT